MSAQCSHQRRCTRLCTLIILVLSLLGCASAATHGVHTVSALADDSGSSGVCSAASACYTYVQRFYIFQLLTFVAGPLGHARWFAGLDVCTLSHVTCRTTGVTLDLRSANLRGSLSSVASMGSAQLSQTMVVRMAFDNNSGITGSLPACWGSLLLLRSLSAAGTGLSGALPSEWSSMTGLQTLLLNDTQISGTLPSTWSSLVTLRTVSLANTNLSGTLPAFLGTLTALESFSAANTNISGTLPSEWAALTGLRTLDLRNTRVHGTIPASWAALGQLRSVSFAGSGITGCLPAAWLCNTSLTEGDVGLPVSSTSTSSSCPSREQVCSAATTTAAPASDDDSLPSWAIAVISVGVVVAVAAAVTVGVVCGLRCARKRRQQRRVVEEALKLSSLACSSEEGLTDASEVRVQPTIKVSESRGSLTSSAPRSTSFAGVAAPCFALAPVVAAAGIPEEAMPPSPMPCVFLDAAPPPMNAGEGYADLADCYPATEAGTFFSGVGESSREDQEDAEVLAMNPLSLQAVACLPSMSSLVESRVLLLQHSAHDTPAAPPVAGTKWDAALCARWAMKPVKRPLTEREQTRLGELMAKETCLPDYGPFIEMDDTGIADSFESDGRVWVRR